MGSINRRDVLSKVGAASAAFAAASLVKMRNVFGDVAPVFSRTRVVRIPNPNPCGPGEFTVVTQATRAGLVLKNVSKGRVGAPGFGHNGEHVVHVTVAADNSFTFAGLDDILTKSGGSSGGSTGGSTGGGKW